MTLSQPMWRISWRMKLLARRKRRGRVHKEPLATLPLAASSRRIGHLLGKVAEGALSGRMAKQVLESLMNSDERRCQKSSATFAAAVKYQTTTN